MATVTEAGRLTSVSDFKVIWCFVHVCVGLINLSTKCCIFFIKSRIYTEVHLAFQCCRNKTDESQNETFTLFPVRFGLCIEDKNICEVVHGQHVVTKCYIKSA